VRRRFAETLGITRKQKLVRPLPSAGSSTAGASATVLRPESAIAGRQAGSEPRNELLRRQQRAEGREAAREEQLGHAVSVIACLRVVSSSAVLTALRTSASLSEIDQPSASVMTISRTSSMLARDRLSPVWAAPRRRRTPVEMDAEPEHDQSLLEPAPPRDPPSRCLSVEGAGTAGLGR
jgi:hypothetical protein